MRNWYKSSVIYEIDVESFMDANGDGCGDFAGLAHSLDYLAGLGVDCIWLLPIYTTPNRDNGYDVANYLSIDARLGDFADFALLLEQAENRGIRVLLDLPFNHTSIDHPWFQAARCDPDSPYRDYYIWAEEKPEDDDEKLIFGEQQEGNWAWDDEAGQYYYHTFYDHEADLNFANPRVREEMKRVMRFWLRQGVSGFRLDALPHMLRQKGSSHFDVDPHACVRELRDFIEHQRPDAVFLAEVDVDPSDYASYFGDGEEVNLLLNFYMTNLLFLALARRSGEPVARALQVLPRIGNKGQWAYFLRNHDELDLERLSRSEFDDVMEAFAPEEDMRIFGRGIRRRLAPMLGDDRRRLELAYSLIFTLPGTPVLRYGQEIAMGDDLAEPGRDAVRTLMQWSDEPNAGFSCVDADELVRPLIEDGPFGYHARNVTDQRRDPGSFLNWMGRAIRMRRDCPEFGSGNVEVVDTGDPRVFAHRCSEDGRFALAVHNFADEPVEVDLALDPDDARHLLDLFGDCDYPAWDPESTTIELEASGYRWLRRTQYSHST